MATLTLTDNDQFENFLETVQAIGGSDTIKVVFYSNIPDGEVGVHKPSPYVVSISMKKDFFTPPDMCTVIIETNNPKTYTQYLQRGNRVDIYLNGNINLKGFIFDVKYDYDRPHTKLIVECKDLLEFLAQASIPPNGNTGGLTNFQFPPNSTLKDCITNILRIYSSSLSKVDDTSIPTTLNIQYGDNDSTDASQGALDIATGDLSTGFGVGLRVHGKSPKAFSKSVNKALNRLNHPDKGETYLHFMERLVKLAGGNIKMAPGTIDTVIIQSPTYDRAQSTPYAITHYISEDKVDQNNVISGKLHFAFDKIHSVIVVEANGLDDDKFHLTDAKSLAVNEMSGYYLVSPDQVNDNLQVKPVVANFVSQLVDLVTNKGVVQPIGPNYQFVDFNKRLYTQRYNLGVDINTSMCQPRYEVSHSAHKIEELVIEAALLMAEEQDKAVQFTYKIKGWSYLGAIWQPNQLVNVIEESLSPGNPKNLLMWIKEVNYYKDRQNGTYVEVICTLPYTHNFELSDTVPGQEPSSQQYTVSTQTLITNSINQLQQQISNENNGFHEKPSLYDGGQSGASGDF